MILEIRITPNLKKIINGIFYPKLYHLRSADEHFLHFIVVICAEEIANSPNDKNKTILGVTDALAENQLHNFHRENSKIIYGTIS